MANRLERGLKKGYNFIKKNTPAPVKKFVAPILNPAIQFVKPVIKEIDKGIDAGVEAAKKLAAEQERKRKEAEAKKERERIEKARRKKEAEDKKKAEEAKIRKELTEKQKNVDEKADQKNDAIHNLSVKSADMTKEEINQFGKMGKLLLEDPGKFYDKITTELAEGMHSGIESVKVGWNIEKTKYLEKSKIASESAQKALEYKRDSKKLNDDLPYWAQKEDLAYSDYKISGIEPTKENIDVSKNLTEQVTNIFNINKALTLKSIETEQSIMDDYKRNKTTLGKFGVDIYSGLMRQVGQPTEIIKNTAINTISYGVGAMTGNPLLGKIIDLGLSAGDNMVTYADEVRLLEGRKATNKEMLQTGVSGALFSEFLGATTKGIKAGVFKSVDIKQKLDSVNPRQLSSEFYQMANKYINGSELVLESENFKPYIEYKNDVKTGIDGDYEQKRFYRNVKNGNITKENYDIQRDPSFKIENNNFRKDAIINSIEINAKDIDPNASIFGKVLQSIPKDIEVENKAGTPYIGTNKIKQHLAQTRGVEIKENMVKALEPTIKAIVKDRENANKNLFSNFIKKTVMGKEEAKEHYFTFVNQNSTHEKIGNSIVSKYKSNYQIMEVDFLNRLSQTYKNEVSGYRDWASKYKKSPSVFSKVFIEGDYDHRTDIELYKTIDNVRNDIDSTIRLDKAWNEGVDPDVIMRNPKLFTADGVDETEAFKLFLQDFKGIENRDLKQIKSVYDFRDVKHKFDGLLRRASEELGIGQATPDNLEMIKNIEKVRKGKGKELYYDTETNSFIWRKYNQKEKKLFGIVKETKTPNLLKISELIEKYMKAPTEEYKNNNFKYLTPDNFKMGRFEAVFKKDKFFNDMRMIFNKNGDLIDENKFNEILPFLKESLDLREEVTPDEVFGRLKEVYSVVKETTKASHLKGSNTELGELLPYFKNYDSMVDLMDKLDLFYNNEDFIENLVNKSIRRQSEYMTLGRPAESAKMDFKNNLLKDTKLNADVEIEDIYLKSLEALTDKVNTAIDNIMIKNKGTLKESNVANRLTKIGIDLANTTYLGLTGLGEAWTNRPLSDLRSFEYRSGFKGKANALLDSVFMTPIDSLKTVGYGTEFTANIFNQLELTEDIARMWRKASSTVMGESKLMKLSNGEKVLLASSFDDAFNRFRSHDSLGALYGNTKEFLLVFQRSSEMQKHVLDNFNTNKAIFDTLDMDYGKISDSTRNLMHINGIGEKEFSEMKPLLQEFRNRGEIIQPSKLLEADIAGYAPAGDLLNLYSHMFYEINTLNKHGVYMNGKWKTFQETSAKTFKGTMQGISFDMLNKLVTFESKDGATKNRFMYAEGWGKTAKYSLPIFGTLAVYGLQNDTGRLQNNILTGRHEAMQYLSKYLAEETVNLRKVVNSENIKELAINSLVYAGEKTLDVLSDNIDAFRSSDLIDLYGDIGSNIYKAFTNQKSIDKGENVKEGFVELGKFGLSLIFGVKSGNIAGRTYRSYDDAKYEKENNEEKDRGTDLIDRIKNEDTRSLAWTIYQGAKGAMTDYKDLGNKDRGHKFEFIEQMAGGFEALIKTGRLLEPSEQSMFKDLFSNFINDEQKVKEFTSEVAGFIDKNNKSEYQMKLENHFNYLHSKLLKGEISEEEYLRLLKETSESANLVVDSEFSLLNKEYASLGNYIMEYRNIKGDEKQLFKEEFMNIINEIQGKDIKVSDESLIKSLDHFIPENEQESFFKFVEEIKNKPKKEELKQEVKSEDKNGRYMVEVVGGGGNYTDVLYSDGTVWRRTGSRAARNNNPGNLDARPWQVEKFNSLGNDKTGANKTIEGTEQRNSVFKTREDGEKAWEYLIFEYAYKNSRIDKVIEAYAPPGENNTKMYQREAMTGIPEQYRNIKMNEWPQKMRDKLMENMFRVEDSGGGFKEVKIGEVEK